MRKSIGLGDVLVIERNETDNTPPEETKTTLLGERRPLVITGKQTKVAEEMGEEGLAEEGAVVMEAVITTTAVTALTAECGKVVVGVEGTSRILADGLETEVVKGNRKEITI